VSYDFKFLEDRMGSMAQYYGHLKATNIHTTHTHVIRHDYDYGEEGDYPLLLSPY